MATSAQIVSLGAWRSPTPANTIEGSFYLLRKSRLSLGERRLLRDMENDLYCGAAGCQDVTGVLERPERVHEVQGVGCITYFWSRRQHMYVLSEFHFLDTDGDGGLPCVSRPWGGGGAPSARRSVAAAACGVAAFASRELLASAVAVIAQLADRCAAISWRFTPVPNAAAPAAVHGRSSPVGLASEVLAVHSLLAGSGPLGRDELPHWSLLREMVIAPEELQNSLARSLVAGELVCRLGRVTGDAWRASSRYGWRSFLPRVDSDWSAPISWRRDEEPERLDALISAWLSDEGRGGVEADALRLLARARLSLVLASHVRRATEQASVWVESDSLMIAPERHLLLRKIHMVTEYVFLSYSVWPAGHRNCGWSDCDVGDGAPTLFKEFDRSVEIIARQMPHTGRPSPEAGSLRDRVAKIAMEIVAPAATS